MRTVLNVFAMVASLSLCGCAGRVESGGHASATTADFQAAIGQPGLVLVDFNATWCGPCRMMTPIVEQAAKDYEGKIKILSIDVDQNQDLAGQYEVRSIPNFVIIKDGKPVDRRVGAMSADDFKKWLDGFVAAGN